MDYRKNAMFFEHKRVKKWTYVSYVGYGFIALAVILFILNGAGMGGGGMWALSAALPFAAVGVAILLTALSMMTSEKQLKEEIANLQKEAEENALAAFDHPDRNPDLFFQFEGYKMTDDSLIIRKLRNGRVFTTVYGITYMMIEKNNLHIYQKRTSLVDEGVEILSKTFPLASLSGAKIINETVKRTGNDGEEHEVKVVAVQVFDNDGNAVCTANCKIYDYDIERFAETLDHNIKRVKMG